MGEPRFSLWVHADLMVNQRKEKKWVHADLKRRENSAHVSGSSTGILFGAAEASFGLLLGAAAGLSAGDWQRSVHLALGHSRFHHQRIIAEFRLRLHDPLHVWFRLNLTGSRIGHASIHCRFAPYQNFGRLRGDRLGGIRNS